MRSLRTRLVLLTMAGTIIVLIATGFVVHRQHYSQLLHNFDASLRSEALNLSGRLLHDDHLISVDETEGPLHVRREAGHVEPTVQVFDLEGKALYEIKPEWALDVGPVLGDLALGSVTETVDATGVPVRAYALRIEIGAVSHIQQRVQPDEPIGGTLVVSARSAHIHAQSHDLALLILKITVLATLLAGVFSWVAVGYGLKPLGALATRISETTPETLNAKIPSRDQPTEVVPVVDRLNELLGRLDEAIVRERTMSTNVAHELRTPVAALISTIEVRLAQTVGQEEENTLGECLSVARGMQSVVSSLLTLSRLESGQMKGEPTDTSLVELVNDIWPTLASDGVEIQADASDDIVLHVDRNLLRISLSNALSNAVRHAPHGSKVIVTGFKDESSAVVSIKNEGCTLTPDEATKVFDRFWRKDESRTDTNLRCGLGATLIRQATEAASGTATAVVDGSTFVLRLRFPLPASQ